jgi:CRP/FNR family cyclic AMP-dependent transcriptional regulator
MPLSAHLAATLRRVPLFSDLSDAELALIGGHVTVRRYDAGAIVFSEGDPCRELLIVQEGSVTILKTAPSGRQQFLSIERTGNSLSEVGVFDEGRYPATARAASATTVLRIGASRFRELCIQHPEMAMKMIKVLGHRLRNMSRLIEELSFSTVRGRLISYLLAVAEDLGQRTPRGIEFTLRENNEELAARLGTVRELVSRNLGRLHGDGWIAMERRTIIIPDIAALREEASRAV